MSQAQLADYANQRSAKATDFSDKMCSGRVHHPAPSLAHSPCCPHHPPPTPGSAGMNVVSRHAQHHVHDGDRAQGIEANQSVGGRGGRTNATVVGTPARRIRVWAPRTRRLQACWDPGVQQLGSSRVRLRASRGARLLARRRLPVQVSGQLASPRTPSGCSHFGAGASAPSAFGPTSALRGSSAARRP